MTDYEEERRLIAIEVFSRLLQADPSLVNEHRKDKLYEMCELALRAADILQVKLGKTNPRDFDDPLAVPCEEHFPISIGMNELICSECGIRL